jgi:valyl-tRNA synthetase
MNQELMPQYNPKEVEEKWTALWSDPSVFHATVDPKKKPYCIVIPPPNVTGILHMGHALNNTIQDILIRYRRMQGYEALWMPGTDHAGIATQNVVERQLAKESLNRHDLGRKDFLKRVWHWKEEHGSTIIHQLKRMGASCDWSRERFTMDEDYSVAVIDVFVRLYEKGLIYRGDYIINWCPRCQTALADEEAPHHELEGNLYYIKYPLKQPHVSRSTSHAKSKKTIDYRLSTIDYIVVATTRPETMLGDTAVAVNPKDKRYKHLIGSKIILPLMEREIEIIADDMVDKKFGTGAVKVTPAHDPNDYLVGKTHNLEFINIMNPDGILNALAGAYAGMDRFEAREAIVEDLKERKLLEKIEPHKHAVGHCYRCHTVVEPYLSKQWFVKMKPLSMPALKAVKTGEIKFHPKRWMKVYLNWMENIKDWCISRQIWWGHRLPVWYCKDCQKLAVDEGVIVSRVAPEMCPVCGSREIFQDEDVLDTWFSSWLWPFATFGWPFTRHTSQVTSNTSEEKDVQRETWNERQKELDYFYPTATLATAPEIIFFWVARMIMAGCAFMGKVPFSDVYLHGTVRDGEGRKMSKSLGNSIDPLNVINDYGTDALRFSLIAIAASGSDIFLSKERFEQGRNFSNKIWNASRFILMNLKEGVTGESIDQGTLKIQDRWIISELNDTTRRVEKALDAFKFNEAVNLLFNFFWHSFCDWYLEIAKMTIDEKNTQEVLLYVLKKTLLLLHPFMPFITDEISSKLPMKERHRTIALEAWPRYEKLKTDKEVLKLMSWVQEIIFQLRFMRHDLKVAPTAKISVRLWTRQAFKEKLETASGMIKHLALIENLEITTHEEVVKNSLSALIDKDLQVYLLLEGLVDIKKEKERLGCEINELKGQAEKKKGLLSNKNFVKSAPSEVVSKEQERLKELESMIKRLEGVLSAFK